MHTNYICAQETVVEKINPSSTSAFHTELFISAGYNTYSNSGLAVAGNSAYSNAFKITTATMSLGIECSIQQGGSFSVNLGYCNSSMGMTRNLSGEGTKAHWLSLDIGIGVCTNYLQPIVGVKNTILLNVYSKYTTSSFYSGINKGCFNKIACIPYLGLRLHLKRIRLEGRIGLQAIPYLNPDRIAYYNMNKTEVNIFYYEFVLGVPIFTTSKHLPSCVHKE